MSVVAEEEPCCAPTGCVCTDGGSDAPADGSDETADGAEDLSAYACARIRTDTGLA